LLATAATNSKVRNRPGTTRNFVIIGRHFRSLIGHQFPSRQQMSFVFSLSSSDSEAPVARTHRIGSTARIAATQRRKRPPRSIISQDSRVEPLRCQRAGRELFQVVPHSLERGPRGRVVGQVALLFFIVEQVEQLFANVAFAADV
jgi:hypothetical protein